MNEVERVHCLKCDDVYKEYNTFIEKCPHCGNEDIEQTVYLVREMSNEYIY
tara:strand:+ start:3648 stop:3800 length:153 start_codon:yes stop_codon:yes gene_type:complete